MNRETFVTVLREGLEGLPRLVAADVVSDYEAHFAEAISHGRAEADVVNALGDPARLARELRAEIRVRNWRQERSPSAALASVVALFGLGTLDALVLLPVLIVAGAVIIAVFAAAIGLLGSAGIMFVSSFFAGAADGQFGAWLSFVTQSGTATQVLLSLSLLAASVAGLSASTLLGIAFVNATIWYGRLHYRIIQPAVIATAEGQLPKVKVIAP